MMTEKQEEFLIVLQQSLGIISVALQKTGVSSEELIKWRKNIFFEERMKKIDDICTDYVENQLLKQIQDGNISAITFYLKTKGKKRGYN